MPDLDTPDVAPSWQMPGGQRLRRHSWLPVTALPRNGLLGQPKPYVYRGTGEDQLAGRYGDPALDADYDF